MPFVLVQNANKSALGTPVAPVFGSGTTTANLLVCALHMGSSTGVATFPAGWLRAKSVTNGANTFEIWYFPNCTSGITTVSISYTDGGAGHAVIGEFSGARTLSGWKFVQAASIANPSVFSGSVVAGNKIIVDVGANAGTCTGVTDSGGNTYTKDKAQQTGGPGHESSIWSAPVKTGGTLSVTVTTTGGNQCRAYEYSGVLGVDVTAGATIGFGSSGSSGNTAVTTGPNELVFGAMETGFGDASETAGTGFTLRVASGEQGAEDKDSGPSGLVQAATFSYSSSNDVAITCVVYKTVSILDVAASKTTGTASPGTITSGAATTPNGLVCAGFFVTNTASSTETYTAGTGYTAVDTATAITDFVSAFMEWRTSTVSGAQTATATWSGGVESVDTEVIAVFLAQIAGVVAYGYGSN